MNYNAKLLLISVFTSVSLVACGGGDAPPVQPVPVAQVPVATPDYSQVVNGGYDYVGQVLIPQLQAYHGNIQIVDDIYIQTQGGLINLNGRVMSWAEMYNTYITGLVSGCANCRLNVQGINGPSTGFNGWAQVDYRGLSAFIEGGAATGGDSHHYYDWFLPNTVVLQTSGVQVSFAQVVNTLIFSNYQVYSYYYQNYYPQQYAFAANYQWPCSSTYGYVGYNQGYRPNTQFQGNFGYSSGNGLSFSVGGSYSR